MAQVDQGRAMGSTRKPYHIDWRFLPNGILERKDAFRHAVNVLGGDKDRASTLGRAWFRFIRAGVARAMTTSGVMFIHIPRTGGSAISRALYGRNLPHVSIAYYRSLRDRRLADLPSFAILRDPFDRLASAYRFLLTGGTQIVASSRFDPLGLRHAPSFDAFVAKIASNPRSRYAYDLLRPQADFICDSTGLILIDRIFLFDDLCSGSPELTKWVGGQGLPRINESVALPLNASASTRLSIKMLYNHDYTLFDRMRATPLGLANPSADVTNIGVMPSA